MKPTAEETAKKLRALQDLTKHPGWAVLCERHAKGVDDLTKQVLDPNLDDAMATRLRHARAVVLALSPEATAKALETVLDAKLRAFERAASSTDGANPAA